MLSVKFNDQHITNSPFTVRVAPADGSQQDGLHGSELTIDGVTGCQVCLSICLCLSFWFLSVWVRLCIHFLKKHFRHFRL